MIKIILIAAIVIFLLASAGVVHKSYLETKLNYIDELVARGADINVIIEKGKIK